MTARFRQLLDGIVAAALVSAGCAPARNASGGGASVDATAAEGDAGASSREDSPFVAFADQATFACPTDLSGVPTELATEQPYDSVTILEQPLVAGGEGGLQVDPGRIGVAWSSSLRKGFPCTSARNRDACMAAFTKARATKDVGWGIRRAGADPREARASILIHTRGDDVGVVTNEAEALAIIAPIDTLDEARYVGSLAGKGMLTCEKHALNGVALAPTGWRRNADGSHEIIAVSEDCGSFARERFVVARGGTVRSVAVSVASAGIICGRRPDGLAALRDAGEDVGAYFAEVAWLEAAAVVAFRGLEDDLVALGAPGALVAAARRAQADEVRHAREASALARRFGAEERPLRVEERRERDAVAIAIENAVEGCVRETYGALVAAYQARAAEEPTVRAFFARIAGEEAEHAELSFAIAAWLEPTLPVKGRARVAAAKAAALAELVAGAEQAPPSFAAHAGLPPAAAARAMLAGLAGLACCRAEATVDPARGAPIVRRCRLRFVRASTSTC